MISFSLNSNDESINADSNFNSDLKQQAIQKMKGYSSIMKTLNFIEHFFLNIQNYCLF
jgi:hypothetical protein